MINSNKLFDLLEPNALAAREKLQYMHDYAKSSTIATVLAPLLCIPLYSETTPSYIFHAWLLSMGLAVLARYFIIKSIDITGNVQNNFVLFNLIIGIVTFIWGVGWFIFVTPSDPVSYLTYQIISLTILFVGMVGYCVSWKTFFSFVVPLKLPELIFIVLNYKSITLPVPMGSMVAFFLALRMVFLFSKSWEKSFSLRLKNDALFDQLTDEKNASIAANIAKSEFIATASHDLRQPMQSINIFVDMIDQQNLKNYERSIFLRMRQSISVLNKMFNALLDISKLDSNFPTSDRYFSVEQLIVDLNHTFQDLCQDKNLELIFNYEDCLVKGDPHLTDQILRNLLSNAIQYADQGKIIVTFKNESEKLTLVVQDSGSGIPPEDLPKIFNEFYRSEHSRSHHDGLGLGLSIVSRIVNKIGGEYFVNSTVGSGSEFSIKTPFHISYKNKDSKFNSNSIQKIQPASKAIDAAILNLGIIENDNALKEAYLQYFTSTGYTVHLIPHQEIDFEVFLTEVPKINFILSDFRLGDRDGIYFIQKLREEFNDEIPACIVTADTSPKHLELFNQLNIHVIYKPMDIKYIEEFIAKSLLLREQRL